MAPRSAAAGLLACVCALLLLALSPSTFVVAVPRLDAFVGDDLDAPRRPPSAASADAATSDAAAAVAAAAIESRTPLDDLTAYWLENADELAARDARLSPEDRALELARRETEWRNAAKRKEQAERMEKGEEEEGGKKSLREMERERKRFKEEKSKDSSTEEGSLDPNANDSNVIDAATLYSPPKATAFKAQGDAPAKISLGKMLTEGESSGWSFLSLIFFSSSSSSSFSFSGSRGREGGKKTWTKDSVPLSLFRSSLSLSLQATTPRPEAAALPRERPARKKTSRAWS